MESKDIYLYHRFDKKQNLEEKKGENLFSIKKPG
jgi:hypothetical protein